MRCRDLFSVCFFAWVFLLLLFWPSFVGAEVVLTDAEADELEEILTTQERELTELQDSLTISLRESAALKKDLEEALKSCETLEKEKIRDVLLFSGVSLSVGLIIGLIN